MATNEWARKRQMMYGGGVVGFLLLLIAPFVFVMLHEKPTCFDGKLNQGETAIDRGGPCALVDTNLIQPYGILWSRAFPVRNGLYNTVAYIENPNTNEGVLEVAYQFKLYDERNILIAERSGTTPVFPGKVFPIYESGIDTGNRIPTRTFFDFTSPFVWEKVEDPVRGVTILNEKLSSPDTSPRIDAQVRNTTVYQKDDIVIIATVFDSVGNAMASARTFVEHISPDEDLPIAFTWPFPFPSPVARVEIVPLTLLEKAN